MELSKLHTALEAAGLPVSGVQQDGGVITPKFTHDLTPEEQAQVAAIITNVEIAHQQSIVTSVANSKVDQVVGNGRARDRILMEVLLQVVVAFHDELSARLPAESMAAINEAKARGLRVKALRTHEAQINGALAAGQSPDTTTGWPE